MLRCRRRAALNERLHHLEIARLGNNAEHVNGFAVETFIVGPQQQPIERDLYFVPRRTLSEYTRLARINGSVID